MRFLSYIHIVMVISALCSVEGRLKATAKHQEQQQQQQQQQQLPSIKVVRRLQTTNELLSYSGSPPERHYPLQLCEGDCDEDSDCDEGLVCYQRDPGTAVPGCMGGEEEQSRTDYCTSAPATTATDNVDTGTAETEEPQQQEDDDNTTTEPVPTPASPTSKPTALRVISTTPAPTSTASRVVSTTPEPTASPTASPKVALSTTSPEPLALSFVTKDTSGAFPLGECQGDCDDDTDCQPGLICFQRDQNEPVPGCLGNDASRSDYCILDPNNRVPTALPTELPTPSPTAMTTSPTPTTSNRPSSFRPTTAASNPTMQTFDFPTDVTTDFPSDAANVTLEPTITPVPSVAPSSAPTIEPLEGIRIKMYWEEGYLWQDETFERKWCMINNYKGFPGTGKCWHGVKTQECDQEMIYISRCDSDKRQMMSIYPIAGGTQYQIGTYGDNMCLERVDFSLVLRECELMNPMQRFWMPRGAPYQKHFELSPITLASYCVTQSHHPKFGEVVELHKCSKARHIDHQSSFWEIDREEA